MVAQFVWKGEMNNRRKLLVALGASVIAAPFALFAQQSEKVYRIGFLSPRPGIESGEEAFRQGLRNLGYVEGQNIVIEWRFTKGRWLRFLNLRARWSVCGWTASSPWVYLRSKLLSNRPRRSDCYGDH
jgi:hypothetical protein